MAGDGALGGPLDSGLFKPGFDQSIHREGHHGENGDTDGDDHQDEVDLLLSWHLFGVVIADIAVVAVGDVFDLCVDIRG